MFKRTNTALAAIATAGSLLAYSALLTPAVAQTAASEHVQLAASYSPVVRNLQTCSINRDTTPGQSMA